MSYNPKRFSLSWGPVPAVGFQDGEMINWSFDNDEWAGYEGTRGEGDMVYSPSTVGTCTVTLQSDSPTNLAWSLAYKAGKPLPLTMADRSSTKMLGFAPKAMPAKLPDGVRDRTKPTTVWTFKFVGGKLEHIGDVV